MIWLFVLVIGVWILLFVRPYFLKYDTVIGFTGGLGTGKSFESVNVAIRELKKNRMKTRWYNLLSPIFKRQRLKKPLLYSSIPIRITKREYAEILTAEHLLLQENIVPGSVVFIDEVDVWANQYAHNNPNVIEILSKRNAEQTDYADGGIFDEHIRLFRHLHASPVCEPKLVVNTQATANIVTVIRRRINTVYVQSNFRIIKIPLLSIVPIIGHFFKFYTYLVRNITITDEITNTSDGNSEASCRRVIGIMPFIRHYDTHCYSLRAEGLEMTHGGDWDALKTKRLLKCPIKKYDNKCNY